MLAQFSAGCPSIGGPRPAISPHSPQGFAPRRSVRAAARRATVRAQAAATEVSGSAPACKPLPTPAMRSCSSPLGSQRHGPGSPAQPNQAAGGSRRAERFPPPSGRRLVGAASTRRAAPPGFGPCS